MRMSTWFMILVMPFAYVSQNAFAQSDEVQIANVSKDGDTEKFESIRQVFKDRNPGYDMTYLSGVISVDAKENTRVIFVQEIGGVTNQDVLSEAIIQGNPESAKHSELNAFFPFEMTPPVKKKAESAGITSSFTIPRSKSLLFL